MADEAGQEVLEATDDPRVPARTANMDMTPSQMLSLAVERGADMDRLEKLMDLNDRWEANQARKAYDAALAEFKLNPPEIRKDRLVDYPSKNQGQVTYNHADLNDATKAIAPALAQHGLRHSFHVKQQDGNISVTCILAHRDGHRESVTLLGAPDNSGGKNGLQAIGSTITYLSRYSLMAITGLASGLPDEDDDGQAAGGRRVEDTPSDAREIRLEAMPDGLPDWRKWAEDMIEAMRKSETLEGLGQLPVTNARTLEGLSKSAPDTYKRLREVYAEERDKLQNGGGDPDPGEVSDDAVAEAAREMGLDEGQESFI